MNVLAIGRYASCAFDAYIPAEKQHVTELREEGFISDRCCNIWWSMMMFVP